MNTTAVILVIQTVLLTITLLIVGWQIYKLRLAMQASSCQDIVKKFFHIVENQDFQKTFSFGSGWDQLPDEQRKKSALFSEVFAFLEQIYVEAGGEQLAERLSGPWVEFVKGWIKQDEMKSTGKARP